MRILAVVLVLLLQVYPPGREESGAAGGKSEVVDPCPCFTAQDIDDARDDCNTTPTKQCVTIGDGHLVRIACADPGNFDFYTDPTPAVCAGGPEGEPTESITTEEYNACRAIQLVECP